MSGTALLVLIGAVLIASGALTAVVMGRRGHNWFGWAILGTALGPLVAFVALPVIRRETVAETRSVTAGESGEGPVHVLVGFDGSDHAKAALARVLDLLGPRLGRLTLATVLEREYERTPAGREDEQEARRALEELSRSITPRPDTVILTGNPARALPKFAEEGGHHLLAIGSRGRGLSRAMLGSVASRLASRCSLPVMIVSAEDAERSIRR